MVPVRKDRLEAFRLSWQDGVAPGLFFLATENNLSEQSICVSNSGVTKNTSIMDSNMNPTNTPAKNVLTSDVEIKGNLKFTGEMAFEGKLDGEIHTDGVLTLGDSAVITGNINAQSVVVRGKVNGNINAKEKIEIKAKAELFGDIRATKLVVEEGVTFVGKTEVNPNKVSPSAQPRTPEPPKPAEPAGKPAPR
jgi:cytoskeletal protein CcmA (bactofilin family)